jgi:AcrR family transcriptional regulator
MDGTDRRIPRVEQRRQTEARVLEQARRLFSERGYDRTTIRAVALAAGTDPALVMRYFGSKAQLFATAAHVPLDEPVTGPASVVAEQLLNALTLKLETDPTSTLTMLRSMLTHPEAATGVRATIASQQRQLADALGTPDASLRTAVFGAMTLGLIISRYLLELDGLTCSSPDEIAEIIRPCIRALIDQ